MQGGERGWNIVQVTFRFSFIDNTVMMQNKTDLVTAIRKMKQKGGFFSEGKYLYRK
jgi:hypothetical protein